MGDETDGRLYKADIGMEKYKVGWEVKERTAPKVTLKR